MKTVLQFMVYSAIVTGAIVIAVIVAAHGLWYFSWLIGTALLVLFAVAGGVLLDTQQSECEIT